MAVEIRETTVTPDEGGNAVQLHISDAKLGDESAAFVLTISAVLPPFENPMLAHLQRAAIDRARGILDKLSKTITDELQTQGYPVEPRPKT